MGKLKDDLKFCPKCKSTNVSIDSTNPLFGSMGVPPTYVCNDCGYKSKIFPEVERKDVDKFKKVKNPVLEDLKIDKVDISYGKFEVRGVWKIFGPLVIIGAIILIILSFNPSYCHMDYSNYSTFPTSVCSTSNSVDSFILYTGIFLAIIGIAMIYFGYFRKYEKISKG